MNILDVLEFMEKDWYDAITVKYKDDGVREIRIFKDNNTQTFVYDPRWDAEKDYAKLCENYED